MRTLKIAIVGSGPSGFYAAEELLKQTFPLEVSMIERLPVPFGLVRSGVAPDHPKLKQPMLVYDRIARSPQFHYLGNAEVGTDLSVGDLLESHHAVIFAYGTASDRRLEIPGESLAGVHSATEFVGWYNGHPDYRQLCFDLSHEAAAIIGQGNVALDVARILATPVDDLRNTDIAEHALDALAESRIREIHIFGRRGPAQAKFTSQELAEFAHIRHCRAIAAAADLELNESSSAEAADKKSRDIVKNLALLRSFAATPEQGPEDGRSCRLHFFRRPIAVLGSSHVQALRLRACALRGEPFHQTAYDLDQTFDFSCGLVFRSIGYRARPIAGLPFDFQRGVLRHNGGRLMLEAGQPLYGMYATGWAKRGANGIIGTNRADSLATVATLLADLDRLGQEEKTGWRALAAKLAARNKRFVTYQEWLHIDRAEMEAGRPKDKPREKFTRIDHMLAAAQASEEIRER